MLPLNTTLYTFPSPPTSPDSPENRKRKHTYDGENCKRKKLDCGLLDKYLQQGGSVNVRDDREGYSLLVWACLSQSVSSVERLLQQQDIDINATHGSDRSTALHIAAAAGFAAGLERLLSHTSLRCIDTRDGRGHTALHRAVLANQPGCVRVLVRSGARVDLPDQDDRLPLQIAVRHRAIDCVHILLAPNLPRPSTSGLLRDAIMGGSSAILKMLLGSDATISSDLINLAVFWNRIDCLEVLLSRQNHPQLCLFDYDSSPLYTAVQHRKIDMVRLLRSHRANPCRPDGSNPSLIYAAAHGFLDMIPLLYTRSTSSATVREAILLSDAIGMRTLTLHAFAKAGFSPLI